MESDYYSYSKARYYQWIRTVELRATLACKRYTNGHVDEKVEVPVANEWVSLELWGIEQWRGRLRFSWKPGNNCLLPYFHWKGKINVHSFDPPNSFIPIIHSKQKIPICQDTTNTECMLYVNSKLLTKVKKKLVATDSKVSLSRHR